MRLKPLAAAVLLVAAAGNTLAADYTFNMPVTPSQSPFSITLNPAPGPVSDKFFFTFPTVPTPGFQASATLSSLNLSPTSVMQNLGLELWTNASPPSLLGSATGSGSSFSLNNITLTPGQQYYYLVTGAATGTAGGTYNFIASASPVPEPETYALFLAGLAAIGFVARRRAPAMAMAAA